MCKCKAAVASHSLEGALPRGCYYQAYVAQADESLLDFQPLSAAVSFAITFLEMAGHTVARQLCELKHKAMV